MLDQMGVWHSNDWGGDLVGWSVRAVSSRARYPLRWVAVAAPQPPHISLPQAPSERPGNLLTSPIPDRADTPHKSHNASRVLGHRPWHAIPPRAISPPARPSSGGTCRRSPPPLGGAQHSPAAVVISVGVPPARRAGRVVGLAPPVTRGTARGALMRLGALGPPPLTATCSAAQGPPCPCRP